jgi:diaminopimelate decarboxylase
MPTTTHFPLQLNEIAGHKISDLVGRFGTPTYVYDAAVLRKRLDDLRGFDVVRFAQKACSNLAICDLFRRGGAMIDSVSHGELRRALQVGYEPQGDPPPVVYTADIFDDEALDLVVQRGIHVNCGSPAMIDQLGQRSPGHEITLRINPGFGHGHSQKTNTGGEQSKHGIWYEQIEDCLLKATQHGLTVTGLHMHIGSGTDMEHLARVCGAMEQAALQVGRTLKSISAGGGLPIAYQEEEQTIDIEAYGRLWDETRKRLEARFGHKISLEIEPGRYLTAESGYLLAEIRAVKQIGGNTFYLVDAGFNTLARPILYGSYHPMAISRREGRPESREMLDVVVGGPLCESGDIFTQKEGGIVSKRTLPAAAEGDYLVIFCAGAYGVVMGSNYNSKPLPAEVLLDGDQAHCIRSRQTYEQMVENESIPAWESA